MKINLANYKYLFFFIPVIIIAGFFLFFSLNKHGGEDRLQPGDKAGPVVINKSASSSNVKNEETVKVEQKIPIQPVDISVTSSSSRIDFVFFGDLMLDRHVGDRIKKYGMDYPFLKLFKCDKTVKVCPPKDPALADIYDNEPLVSTNLEGAVTNNGKHYPPDNSYDFAFDPKVMENLHKFNINFFSLANNHLSDQGQAGVEETVKNLDKLKFDHAGCTDGLVGDCSYKIIELKGKKIGMVSLSMVYKKFDQKKAKELIAKLSGSTDFVIVNVHWGSEYIHQFSKIQQEIAHGLADAGAGLIIGHHPHVVQGMEAYRPKPATKKKADSRIRVVPIFYSLGNFVFDQYFSADTQEELGVGISIDDTGMKISLFPLSSVKSQPEILSGALKKNFFKKFIGWSQLSKEEKTELEKEGMLAF